MGTGGLSKRNGRSNPPSRVTYLDFYGIVSLFNVPAFGAQRQRIS